MDAQLAKVLVTDLRDPGPIREQVERDRFADPNTCNLQDAIHF
ncbi:hypothetical protein [Kribbella sp. NBC_00359]